MKIAYDAKRFFQNASGLGNYSRDLVRIMAAYYPENQYLLLNSARTERGAEILKERSVSYIQVSKGKFSRQLKAGKIAQGHGSALFHGLSGELPLAWNHSPIKKIVTIHDLIFLRFPRFYTFWDRKIHFYKFKKATEQADLVIAISEQTKKDVIRYLKVPPEKIRVVYQGCHQVFKEDFNTETAAALNQNFALPERFILNVGSIEERKDVLSVIKAITQTNIPLVIVGKKTGYFKKIQKFIHTNNLKEQIYFLENINMAELATLYKMADIFVYPSLFEGFGIPVIEALYSGTAVITSNSSALPEAGGPDAMYIQPGNVEDLRSKISFLWNNKAERERRAEKGFQFVQKFNDEHIAKHLMAVYDEVLQIK